MNAAFAHRVRVYWEDTDAGGVVFYANYLRFFERARTEWLRAKGWGQQALRDEFGVIFVVLESHVRHLAPARLDDELLISVALEGPARASLTLAQAARRDVTLLADGRITIACVDAGTFRPRRIPKAVLQSLA
jgi:acyl-CoA thioester hydrolase